MTLIVIDSIRYNLFFSYNVSAVVFIKSIPNGGLRPSYDRIDEQELVPGITKGTT